MPIYHLSKTIISDILSRTDIVDVIGERLKIKKMGQNYVALCPFHKEKTPSFVINGQKQFYHCFGCGASGNAIGFLMEFENLSFRDAATLLANRVGIEIPQNESFLTQEEEDFSSDYEFLKKIAQFYQQALLNDHEAISYFQKRGITKSIFRLFELGFASGNSRELIAAFPDTSKLYELGLINANQKAKFCRRVVFPIHDLQGNVIGFGGRVLDQSLPKYLNSQETKLFHKKNEIYGLYQVKKANPKVPYLIVVEGYFDVISLFRYGIKEAVATLGTSISRYHVLKLLRITNKIYFCFDGDVAGQKAAWRALEVVLSVFRDDMDPRFVFLPETEDPDSFVKKNGPEKFRELLEKALSLSTFFFDHLQKTYDLKTLEGKAKAFDFAAGVINQMPESSFQKLLWQKLRELTGLNANNKEKKLPLLKRIAKNKEPPKQIVLDVNLRKIIKYIIEYPNENSQVDFSKLLDVDFIGKNFFEKIMNFIKQDTKIDITGVLLSCDDAEKNLLTEIANEEVLISETDAKMEIKAAVDAIINKEIEKKIKTLIEDLKTSSETNADEKKKELQDLISRVKNKKNEN